MADIVLSAQVVQGPEFRLQNWKKKERKDLMDECMISAQKYTATPTKKCKL
jgi:hypothetical protein